MRKLIICALSALLCLGCASTKHIDKSVSESQKTANTAISSDIHTNVTETTDNDKVKVVTITEYVTVYDTITKSYPVKSVTEIREEDKSKVVKEDKSTQLDSVSVVVNESNSVKSDVTDESKPSASSYWNFFLLGMVLGVVLVILVRLAIKYLKTQLGLGWL